MAWTYQHQILIKKHKEEVEARQQGKIPRTDRLDGGAALDKRRHFAEEQRAKSRYKLIPQDILCPRCGNQDLSVVSKKRGRFTWLLCLMCCLWAPFCDCTKDTVHSCAHCKSQLGICEKLG